MIILLSYPGCTPRSKETVRVYHTVHNFCRDNIGGAIRELPAVSRAYVLPGNAFAEPGDTWNPFILKAEME